MPRAFADPPVRSRFVGTCLAYVRDRGGDACALARDFALPDVAEETQEITLPLSKLQAFGDAAARVANDHFIGIHLASHFRRGVWDALEFGGESAPTLRDALRHVARSHPLFNEHVEVTFEEDDGAGSLVQRVPGNPLCAGRHLNEFWPASMLLRARLVTGAPCVPSRAWFAHAAPDDVSELIELLGTSDVEFNAGSNGLVFSDATLRAPLHSSNPQLLALIERYTEQSLSERTARAPVVARVRDAIRCQLSHGAPSIACIARALGVSVRTLQRALLDEQTTYQHVLDGVREELARQYVAANQLTVAEVTEVLGYSEKTAFLRAFKRWTGMTPKQLQRLSRAR